MARFLRKKRFFLVLFFAMFINYTKRSTLDLIAAASSCVRASESQEI
jgi:hypothetical protein